jgi:hypothetical protein
LTAAVVNHTDRARAALMSLDPCCDRETWVRTAMACKAAGLDDDEFVSWSKGGGNFKSAGDCRSVWRSIQPSGGVTAATLFRLARDAGWRDGEPSGRPIARAPVPQQAPQRQPFDWRAVWDAAEPATPEHPYIARKRGLPEVLRTYRGPLRLAGQALDGALLVPAFDASGELVTWQAIPPEHGGRKLNAPGQSMTGTFTVGGPVRDGAQVFVTEGLATGWSVHQATLAPAVIAFGSGRMKDAARDIRARFPCARIVLAGDVGTDGLCAEIAVTVGGEWVVPTADLGGNGDFSDMHRRDGLAAVAELLGRAQRAEAAATGGLRAVPAAEFVAAAGTPEYLLDGVLQRGFVYALTGQTGAGKTAVAISMAASLALGRDFAGRETVQTSVLYVASENPDDIRARVLAWCQVAGVAVEALSDRLHFVDESFTLAERHGELMAAVESVGAAVVVLDTDQALAGSEDENNNSERIGHAKRVRELSRASSRPCVIDLCHPPAGAGRATLRPRGGSSFLGEVDGNVGLWRDESSGLVELFKTGKFRGPDFEPLVFELREVPVAALRDSKGRAMVSVVAVPASAADDARLAQEGRTRLLAVLRSVSADPDASQRQRSESLGLPRTAVQRALQELVDGGALKRDIGGSHTVTEKGKRWLVSAI